MMGRMRIHIWRSIALWAVLAAASAVAVTLSVSAFYPSVHFGVLALLAFMAVQAVYLFRGFARRRGWAIPTYAPRNY